MVFKLVYFVEFKIGYQPAKFQCEVGFLGQVLQKNWKKYNDDVIVTAFQIFGIGYLYIL